MNIMKYLSIPTMILLATFMVTGCDRTTVNEEGTDSDATAEEVRNDAQLVTDKEIKEAREKAEEAADEMSDAAQDMADDAENAVEDVKEEFNNN